MREDMYKVVIEKPRVGSHLRSKKYSWSTGSYDPDRHDDQPSRVSSSRHRQYGWDARSFTDVLGPLRRFLEKAVGRPWNDVYSEINASLDASTVTGRHIFTHVWQFVEKEVTMHKGVAYTTVYGRPIRGMYIHPKTGILCMARYETKAQRRAAYYPPNPDVIAIKGLDFYLRLSGLWYRVTLREITEKDYFFGSRKNVLRFDKNGNLADMGRYVIATKKQLNTKEIRRLPKPA